MPTGEIYPPGDQLEGNIRFSEVPMNCYKLQEIIQGVACETWFHGRRERSAPLDRCTVLGMVLLFLHANRHFSSFRRLFVTGPQTVVATYVSGRSGLTLPRARL